VFHVELVSGVDADFVAIGTDAQDVHLVLRHAVRRRGDVDAVDVSHGRESPRADTESFRPVYHTESMYLAQVTWFDEYTTIFVLPTKGTFL